MNTKKQSKLFFIFLASLLIVFSGMYMFGKFSTKKSNEANKHQLNLEDGIQVQVPEELIDQTTGELDQAAFESDQQLSKDDSLDTLETELNGTIILEEDFSDL